MPSFHITGQIPLQGSITISGRKNAALKLIAATLLTTGNVRLERIPEIGDVATMLKILETLGAEVQNTEGVVHINTAAVSDHLIPIELGRKLRASLVFVGPLLARFGQVTFPHPGGCVIGKRSIAPHLEAFRHLGAQVEFDGNMYHITSTGLRGGVIYLKERSVTATENLIMAAVRATGTTIIYNAACEQHISNLCDLLRSLGYSIGGDGTPTITIEGTPDLSSQDATIATIADEIEIGTYAVAAAVTKGEVTLQQVGPATGLLPIFSALDDFNVQYTYNAAEESLQIHPSHELKAASIKTNPWPGFPPDLQSPFTVLATQAEGTSLIHDWMYEGRLYFVDLLQKMGANIVICDPHRALVSGPTPLYRSSSITPDLRAGAALIVAALAAEGTSIIEHGELIDRGYVRIEETLRSLGAQITRE